MNQTQNIKDVIFPLKIMWLALSLSILVNNVVYISLRGSSLSLSINPKLGSFFIFLIACFSFVVLFHKRFDQLITSINTQKAPFVKNLSEDEKSYLKYYSKYFLYFLICWLINDFCSIAGFVASYTNNNYLFLLISSSIALTLNLYILKPNYHLFRMKKRTNE